MQTFILSGEVTISVYTSVEAETLEEATQKSENRPVESAQWGHKDQKDEAWVSDEYDGEVQNIHQEE